MGGEPLANIVQAAAAAVAQVLEGRSLTEALARVLPSSVAPSLRGGATDAAYGTLRAFARGDFLLGRLVERPLQDRQARALLLVALQLLERGEYTEHTLVNEAVTAASLHTPRFKGLVNAVLRRYLRERERLTVLADADEPARLGHPDWWIRRVREAYGSRAAHVLAMGNTHPPMGLRVNRRRSTTEHYIELLAQAGMAGRRVAPDALVLEKPVPVSLLPGFDAGLVSVQDTGAQHAAHLIDLQPGLRVLDACAAPGGKTAHMLETADVQVDALDVDPARCRRIEENLSRLGLQARVRVADCLKPDVWWDGQPYDRILADVPCSASGVVRRHPDAKWLRRVGDIPRFARTQSAILQALWPLLAKGGRLLYVTCSVFPEEGEGVIGPFLERHRDARRLAMPAAEPVLLPGPDHDGFFFTLMSKV